MGKSDVSREGITLAKVMQPLHLLLPKNNEAAAKLDEFTDLNIEDLSAHLNRKILGVILDVDECVAPHHGEILEKNVKHILAMVNAGVRLVIFSNMKNNGRYDDLIQRSDDKIQVIQSVHPKPDPRGFKECLDALDLSADQVVMVGDNPITDGGSVQSGISFVRIDPIPSKNALSSKRMIQVGIRRAFSALSDLYDVLFSREPLCSDS